MATLSDSLKTTLRSMARSTEDAVELENLLSSGGSIKCGEWVRGTGAAVTLSAISFTGGAFVSPFTGGVAPTYDTEIRNEVGNMVSGVLTVTEGGRYEIVGNMQFRSASSITPCNGIIGIAKNGSVIRYTNTISTTNGIASNISVTSIVELSAGDTIAIVVGRTLAAGGGSFDPNTGFIVKKIG